MYRMNMSGGITPRDRLDPRLLERHMMMDSENSCGCERERSRSSCSLCNQRRSARTMDERSYSRFSRQSEQNGCGCGEIENSTCEYEETNSDFNHALAMVYSPHQEWQNLYCVEEGMMAGTIFRELDKPFYGPKCHGGSYDE